MVLVLSDYPLSVPWQRNPECGHCSRPTSLPLQTSLLRGCFSGALFRASALLFPAQTLWYQGRLELGVSRPMPRACPFMLGDRNAPIEAGPVFTRCPALGQTPFFSFPQAADTPGAPLLPGDPTNHSRPVRVSTTRGRAGPVLPPAGAPGVRTAPDRSHYRSLLLIQQAPAEVRPQSSPPPGAMERNPPLSSAPVHTTLATTGDPGP